MRISDWSSDVCSSDLGSFAKAAEVLHRVPSAITYTVQKLESDLGVQLFDRSGKRAKLTDAGQALVERGRSLLREAESLENCVQRVAHGWELQLTLAIDEIVPLDPIFPLIAEFDRHGNGTDRNSVGEGTGVGVRVDPGGRRV